MKFIYLRRDDLYTHESVDLSKKPEEDPRTALRMEYTDFLSAIHTAMKSGLVPFYDFLTINHISPWLSDLDRSIKAVHFRIYPPSSTFLPSVNHHPTFPSFNF